MKHVVPVELLPQPSHSMTALRGVHEDGLVEGVRDPVQIVGIDEEGVLELVGGTREFTQDQGPFVLGFGGHELLGDEVHSISKRSDEHDVRGHVVGNKGLLFEVAVEVLDRDTTGFTETSVDPPNDGLDPGAEGLVVRNILTTRDPDLYEDEFFGQLGFLVEEGLDRAQAHVDAFGVVKAVDSQDELALPSQVPAEFFGEGPNFGTFRQLLEGPYIDGDGEGPRPGLAPSEVDVVSLDLCSEETPGDGAEIAGSIGGLEADQRCAKHAFEQGDTPRKLREKLGGGKGDVEEETDPGSRMSPFQKRGDELEMEVVHPAGPIWIHALRGDFRELLVDTLVGSPPAAVEFRGAKGVVVQGPEGPIGEAGVVLFDLFGLEGDGDEVDSLVPKGFEVPGVATSPAYPTSPLPEDRDHGANEAAGACLPTEAPLTFDALNRQTIRDDREPLRRRGHGLLIGCFSPVLDVNSPRSFRDGDLGSFLFRGKARMGWIGIMKNFGPPGR